MNRNQQIKLGAILSYASIIVSLIIQVVYTPLMLRLLGQSEYGLYTLVSNVVSYLSLFSLGFTGAYLRYYSQAAIAKDKKEVYRLNGMFLTIFMIMGLAAFVCGFVLSLFPEQVFGNKLSLEELEKSKFLLRILVINIVISFPMSVFDSIIISQEKFVFQKLLTIVKNILGPLVTLPLLIIGYGSVVMVTITTIVSAAQFMISVFYCYKKLGIRFMFDKFNFSKIRDISSFSFFILLIMIIDQLNWSIDNLILGRVVGTLEVAINGVALQIRKVFSMFSSPISSVYAPTVNRIVTTQENDMDERLTDLMIKVGRIQFIILLYIFVGFVFCGKRFVMWWAGNEYVDSYLTTIFLVAPLVYVLPCSMGTEIMRAKNMHRFPAVIMLISAIVNFIFSIPLAYLFGARGTAFATAVSLTINIIWLGIYYTKKLHLGIKRVYANILSIFIKMIVPVCFGLIGLRFSKGGVLFIWVVLYSLIYLLFLLLFVLNSEEKESLLTMVRHFRRERNG